MTLFLCLFCTMKGEYYSTYFNIHFMKWNSFCPQTLMCTCVSLLFWCMSTEQQVNWDYFESDIFNHQLSWTHYARCTNKGRSMRTWKIIPFQIVGSIEVSTVFISSFIVWLSWIPKDKVQCRTIRPHPAAFFVDITESDPGVSLSWVKVLYQELHKIIFLQIVNRHQVGSLWPTLEFCISPGQMCSDVLVAASVEVVPEHGTASTQQLHLMMVIWRSHSTQSQTKQEEEQEHVGVRVSVAAAGRGADVMVGESLKSLESQWSAPSDDSENRAETEESPLSFIGLREGVHTVGVVSLVQCVRPSL